MDLENIMLSKISQSEKDKCCVISKHSIPTVAVRAIYICQQAGIKHVYRTRRVLGTDGF